MGKIHNRLRPIRFEDTSFPRNISARIHPVPSDLRYFLLHLSLIESNHFTRDDVKPIVLAELITLGKQEMCPKADAQHRLVFFCALLHGLHESTKAQPSHARFE